MKILWKRRKEMNKNWILIDDSHPRFDRWQHCTGFVEAFDKEGFRTLVNIDNYNIVK